jgi:uncharacterized protein YggE
MLLLCVPIAFGQEASEKAAPASIRVVGEAVVTAKPDQAQVDIGVVTEAKNAQAAAAANAEKLEAVLANLRTLLGAGADIKSTGYALTPLYHHPKEGATPAITGYSATSLIQVKTNDLTQVGKIIDTATQSQANRIQNLQFSLRDEQALYLQALREAAARARAKAEAIGAALGLKIVRVLNVEENRQLTRPLYAEGMQARATAASVQTPVEPGSIEVRAAVTLTVEIAP